MFCNSDYPPYWYSKNHGPAANLRKFKKKQNPRNKDILQFKIWKIQLGQAVETVNFRLYFKVIIRQNDDLEKKSKIYSLNCLSCFIHILNCKMSLFFGFCFFLYWYSKFTDLLILAICMSLGNKFTLSRIYDCVGKSENLAEIIDDGTCYRCWLQMWSQNLAVFRHLFIVNRYVVTSMQ